MSELGMEYLPITVEQAAIILLKSMSTDEVKLIQNMTQEDFETSNFLQDYEIIEKFGLEDGNLALLEDCTNIKNKNTPSDLLVFLVSAEEAAEIIFKTTVELISSQKFTQGDT